MAPKPLHQDYPAPFRRELRDLSVCRKPSLKRPPSSGMSSRTNLDQGKPPDFYPLGDGDGSFPDPDVAASLSRELREPVSEDAQIDPPTQLGTRPITTPDFQRKPGFDPSIVSASESSQDARTSTSSNQLPDFFSQAVFHTVLHNPTISHQLLKFSQSRLCGENMEFLAKVGQYQALLNEVSKAIYDIHKEFISNTAPQQVNITDHSLTRVNSKMKSSLGGTLPVLESVFADAQLDIERLVYGDIYPTFVRHQMSVSAARALGTDRSKYGGLGDCFVLTNPNLGDNPIVYASDGFVQVTGYSRAEIMPRNCRFLQGRNTDQSSVRRLKASLEKSQASVELLLNEKKSGEPFWNLLYTTPLFAQGHDTPVFFLGGQINCSTTVHSGSDVLRILAQSEDNDKTTTPFPVPHHDKQSRNRGVLNVLRSSNRPPVQVRSPGMEDAVLNQMGNKPLQSQMSAFYNAYSNFLVINYSTFLISFVSSGVVDCLFPIKAKTTNDTLAVGNDIFKYLANSSTGSLPWDFKSTVKSAMKSGKPVTVDLKLCARPYMGFDTFALHWTPLKDEHGTVHWIVLTLGNERRVGLAM